jgi:hypothetical protein
MDAILSADRSRHVHRPAAPPSKYVECYSGPHIEASSNAYPPLRDIEITSMHHLRIEEQRDLLYTSVPARLPTGRTDCYAEHFFPWRVGAPPRRDAAFAKNDARVPPAVCPHE